MSVQKTIDLLMMRRLKHKIICLATCLAIILLLSNQAMSCIFPSMPDMQEGRAMDCCAEHCRAQKTPQAAQQACEQSRTALSQNQPMAKLSTPVVKITFKDLSDAGLIWQQDGSVSNPVSRALPIASHRIAIPYPPVDLYILIHSLLI